MVALPRFAYSVVRRRWDSSASQWQVRELHPTIQAYETRLDSGPPASMESCETRVECREPEEVRVFLWHLSLNSPLSIPIDQGESRTPKPTMGHDVLSVACLPVAPLGHVCQ